MTVIAIVSQKGGAGKTTLAINLAAAAQRQGATSLVIDADPQATASQWSDWRDGTPPEVIDSAPPRIEAKVAAAKRQGATFIVIDTPPHSDSAATKACMAADHVLIPCRPSAFDLAAVKITLRLVQTLGKRASIVFTGGPPNAKLIYRDAEELLRGFDALTCPVRVPGRAAYRHAAANGQSVFEFECRGKAASEIAQLHMWACEHITNDGGNYEPLFKPR